MYDHHQKAGNRGDVAKHPALIAAVDALLGMGRREPFRLLEPFAGYARNPLVAGGEWTDGIGSIRGAGKPAANPHVEAWLSQWRGDGELAGRDYPGSSCFVWNACRRRGVPFRASLWDISPRVVANLDAVYGGLDVEIHNRPAEPSELAGGDLLFVDPPGTRSAAHCDYPALDDLLALSEGHPHLLLWLPLRADESAVLADSGLPITTVRWSETGSFCGCRLVYRLPAEACLAVRAAVEAVLTRTDWTQHEVEHTGRI